ncbi:MAG: hypothetical protein AABW59_01000 [archaeon]
MVFSLDFNKPSKEEILCVKKLAKYAPEELDSKELWILEQVPDSFDDDDGVFE